MGNKKITISIVAVLVIAIISLGIAFATFSTTLNINGSATVESTAWDIYFTTAATNGAKPTTSTSMPSNTISTNSNTVTNATASILATTFTWHADFKTPGDKVVYTIYVKNGGDYNAQVSNIVKPAVQCTTDPDHACQYISYNLYTDSTGQTPLTTSFTVDAGDTEVFYLIAELSSSYGGNDGTGLVSSNLTTDSVSATVTFQQVSSAVTNGGNSGGNGGNSGGEEPSQDIYLKTVSGEQNVCVLYNSTEYCFGRTTTSTDVSQFCTSIGETSSSGEGCNHGEAESCAFGDYELRYEEAREIDENSPRTSATILISNYTNNHECSATLHADPNDYHYDTSRCN